MRSRSGALSRGSTFLAVGCIGLVFASFPCPAALLDQSAATSETEEYADDGSRTGGVALPDAPSFLVAAENARAGLGFRLGATTPKVTSPVGANGTPLTQREIDVQCQTGQLHGKPCKLRWFPMLWQTFEITALDDLGNIAMDQETRHDLVTNPYWSTYVKCVDNFRWNQWSDDTPFIVHNIGHPMQGAIVYSIYSQNDPKSRGLLIVNDGNYWRSRLKAMAWVSLFEIQWKIGPIGEAAIGNSGLNTYYTPRVKGRTTNETGFEDLVITPVYGLGWNMMEDLADRHIMPKVWRHTHNKWVLAAASVMTPSKAVANALRYKPFYYRDFPIPPVRDKVATN